MIVVTLEVCGVCGVGGVGGTIKLKQLKQVEALGRKASHINRVKMQRISKNIKESGLEVRLGKSLPSTQQLQVPSNWRMSGDDGNAKKCCVLRFHSFMFSSLHLFYLFISYSDSVHVLSISLHISFPCSFRFIPIFSFSTASTDSTSLHDPISNHWATPQLRRIGLKPK